MAAAAERLRAVGREIAAALPADGEDAKGELKVEHAGSQFVFSGADGPRRLLRVVWAGGCEPAFLDVRARRAAHLDRRPAPRLLHGGPSAQPVPRQVSARRAGVRAPPGQRASALRHSRVARRRRARELRPGRGRDRRYDSRQRPAGLLSASGRQGHLDPGSVRRTYQDRPGVPALLKAGKRRLLRPLRRPPQRREPRHGPPAYRDQRLRAARGQFPLLLRRRNRRAGRALRARLTGRTEPRS